MAAQVVVPQLGESVVEARVARWLKKEGDAIAVGDPLVELETEKIDLEVNADQAGVLGKILRQEGEDVKVGEPLASIEAGSGAPAEAAAPTGAAPPPDAPASATPAPPEAITP
ncbi:biotin/lipoyl-containing protein, partial [Luteitalea sp.]|uniref:biotin/lipoyl-containing protein n=1 Tax=Luteitalea sp. TaxID=2004800 RepID=UPI0025B97BA0